MAGHRDNGLKIITAAKDVLHSLGERGLHGSYNASVGKPTKKYLV